MFSKKILQADLAILECKRAQQIKCRDIISRSILNLIESNNLSRKHIEEEKTAINDMHDQLLELTKEIKLLEEGMFLNYVNEFTIKNSPQATTNSFPHISTIDQ